MVVPHSQLSARKVYEHENTGSFYTGQAPGPTVPKKDMLQPGWGAVSLPTFLSSEFHSCSCKDPWLALLCPAYLSPFRIQLHFLSPSKVPLTVAGLQLPLRCFSQGCCLWKM